MSFRIGVAGAGFMGRGIATCFLAHEFPVKVFDPNLTDAAAIDIESFLRELVEHDAADPKMLGRWRAIYQPVKSVEEFADCDFVIESVSENLETKQKLFDQLEQIIRDNGVSQVILLEFPLFPEANQSVIQICDQLGIRLLILSDLEERLRHSVTHFEDGGFRFIGLREEPLENPLNRFLKRAIEPS